MGQKHRLAILLDVELYDLSMSGHALKRARQLEGVVYTWHTTGGDNWLRRGISGIDTLGLVILPPALPDHIDLLPDENSEEP